MASKIPVQWLFLKLLHFAGTKIIFFFNSGSFQNKGPKHGINFFLSLTFFNDFVSNLV
jgi:hypothetical protein